MTTIENCQAGGKLYKVMNGTYYSESTPDAVIRKLEFARQFKLRVRIFLGKGGKVWNEAYDIIGYIGCSTGDIKVPLIIYDRRSRGGAGILSDCIIKIVTTEDKKVIYQEEGYTLEGYIEPKSENEYNVFLNDTLEAVFSSKPKAIRWLDFMVGRRFNK